MSASDQDSVRSRAAAGLCYVAGGGVICAVALLMRSGVSTISSIRDGEIPLEMVAGIAGVVVFMGILLVQPSQTMQPAPFRSASKFHHA